VALGSVSFPTDGVMTIKILHQYHNNMYDTVKALETLGTVEFLSYRESKLPPDIRNAKPKTYGRPPKMYAPLHLWRLLNGTDSLILKHIHSPLNAVPYLIAWLRHIPLVIIVQRFTPPRSRLARGALWLLCQFLNARQAHVISVTNEGFESLNPYVRNLTYLPMAIDATRWRHASLDKGRAGGISLNLLTVSKYQRRKRLDILLHAVAALIAAHSDLDIRLTIIGTTTREPESVGEYQRVLAHTRMLDLASRVTLLRNVAYADMPTHFAAADIFVLPAEREPLGYAVIEAMAAGLPVVVSSDVGAASYVKPGVNGYVFQSGSSQDLAARLSQVISQRERLGANGRQVAETEHSPARWVEFFQNLLH
jgi:glycosyltransferase involved in cell wall biosynthesis